MILARCPACGTTFRVRPEQLHAREGRVRCGQCNYAFNALEARVGDDAADAEIPGQAAPAASPETPPPAPLFVLEEKAPDAATLDAAPHAVAETALPTDAVGDLAPPDFIAQEEPVFSSPAPDSAVEPVFETAAFPDDAGRVEPVFDFDAEAPQEWPPVEIDTHDDASPPFATETADETPPVAAAPLFQPGWPTAADLDLKTRADEPVDFDALLRKQDTTDASPAPKSDEHAPPAGIESQARPLAAPIPQPAFTTRDATDHEPAPIAPRGIGDAIAETEDEDGGDADRATPALRQAAWAAGVTLLSLALLAQCVLVFRSEIVQSSPQFRPFMENLCAGLGCELPLPQDASEIAIESSDIQPDASREAFFTLHATLRNRADFPQAYPHLEITLTDARDKALVRKVLEPTQWLPGNAPKDAFPAKREVATRISFEAPGVAAAGYRVYVFYP